MNKWRLGSESNIGLKANRHTILIQFNFRVTPKTTPKFQGGQAYLVEKKTATHVLNNLRDLMGLCLTQGLAQKCQTLDHENVRPGYGAAIGESLLSPRAAVRISKNLCY